MLSFTIGEGKFAHLTVQVFMRSHPGANDYWDGNWVDTVIDIVVGGFQASFGACLRTEEFVRLQQGLEELYSNLSGNYKFETTEQQISFQISGDGKGHFEVRGVAIDRPGDGNELQFLLAIDQTYIPKILSELDKITKEFPIIGSPD